MHPEMDSCKFPDKDRGKSENAGLRLDCRMRIKATPEDVRRALGAFCEAVRPLGLSAELTGTVELVLAEVLNNIVEHAYAGANAGQIEFHAYYMDSGFRFEIADGGREMPGGLLPVGDHVDLDTDLNALPEGGFGWYLIHDLTENLQYHRADGQNRLCFTIPDKREFSICSA